MDNAPRIITTTRAHRLSVTVVDDGTADAPTLWAVVKHAAGTTTVVGPAGNTHTVDADGGLTLGHPAADEARLLAVLDVVVADASTDPSV